MMVKKVVSKTCSKCRVVTLCYIPLPFMNYGVSGNEHIESCDEEKMSNGATFRVVNDAKWNCDSIIDFGKLMITVPKPKIFEKCQMDVIQPLICLIYLLCAVNHVRCLSLFEVPFMGTFPKMMGGIVN